MHLNLKRLFRKQKSGYYSFKEEPDLTKGYEFFKIDETVVQKVREALIELQNTAGGYIVEPILKKKRRYEYPAIGDMANKIINDLEDSYKEFSKEFDGESLRFRYIIGKELILSNSVEIVQQIFDAGRNDIGQLLYSLVIKYNKGKFVYWTW